MKFEEDDNFKKDVKRLLKKFHTLPEDIDVIKRVLEIYPGERPPFSFRVPGTSTDHQIIELRKIACRSLKDDGANSGLRLTYAWSQKEGTIAFLALYYKDEKKKENPQRLMKEFH